jgi:hypothetical protein
MKLAPWLGPASLTVPRSTLRVGECVRAQMHETCLLPTAAFGKNCQKKTPQRMKFANRCPRQATQCALSAKDPKAPATSPQACCRRAGARTGAETWSMQHSQQPHITDAVELRASGQAVRRLCGCQLPPGSMGNASNMFPALREVVTSASSTRQQASSRSCCGSCC